MRAWTNFAQAVVCALAALTWSAPAQAAATLETQLVEASCTLYLPDGTSRSEPCGTSWSVTLDPGWRAELVATFSYEYQDDGLPLATPGFFQLDVGGLRSAVADHEAGGVVIQTSNCATRGRPCYAIPTSQSYGGDLFSTLLVSNNNFADVASGEFTATAVATYDIGSFTSPWSANLFVNAWPLVYSSSVLAPIPEPATWALFAAGMLALVVMHRRRQVSR